ncbi:MAG: trypsin-like peptidase domain-containing protein [Planctomycetota bacterium]
MQSRPDKLFGFLTAAALSATACTAIAQEGTSAGGPIAREDAVVSAAELSAAFRHAAEKIEPSVVHIVLERSNRRGFRQQTGVGSGVILDPSGFVLTNNHVTESGQQIRVRLSDGREEPAEIVGAFAETDLAVLKIDAEGLVPARFGDSEAIGVGEWVIAVGSPFGFEQTVTAGIISAKGRAGIDPRSMNEMPGRFQEFLQTDAAINPGNSGGPLVDLEGNIIGINTAIASSGGGSNGLGFAIPADIARAVAERIVRTGRVRRGWLGVTMDPLDPDEAIALGLEGGVLVSSVLEDSPAERAGVRDGDIIVSLGGRATESIIRLGNAIMLAEPGTQTTIELFRAGFRVELSAVLADRDTAEAIALGGARIERTGLIVEAARMVPQQRGRRRPPISGFRVTDVIPGSVADVSGFERDDFIYEVGDRRFEDARELEAFLERVEHDGSVRVGVVRGNQAGAIYLRTQPEE